MLRCALHDERSTWQALTILLQRARYLCFKRVLVVPNGQTVALEKGKPRLRTQTGVSMRGSQETQHHTLMTRDNANKLLQKWGKPVLLEVLKGAAKAIGFYLIAHFLR
jgi:hypothetical protein